MERFLNLGYGDRAAFLPLLEAGRAEVDANEFYVEILRTASADGQVTRAERAAIDAAADRLWAAEARAFEVLMASDLGASAAAMGAVGT